MQRKKFISLSGFCFPRIQVLEELCEFCKGELVLGFTQGRETPPSHYAGLKIPKVAKRRLEKITYPEPLGYGICFLIESSETQ